MSEQLSLKEKPSTSRRASLTSLALQHSLEDVLRHEQGHIVVSSTSGEDHVGMKAHRLGLVGRIIGVDTDAVAPDKPGTNKNEIPFGASGLEHSRVARPKLEQHGQFVHQCDVDIALDILDHFGRFRHTDRTRA